MTKSMVMRLLAPRTILYSKGKFTVSMSHQFACGADKRTAIRGDNHLKTKLFQQFWSLLTTLLIKAG